MAKTIRKFFFNSNQPLAPYLQVSSKANNFRSEQQGCTATLLPFGAAFKQEVNSVQSPSCILLIGSLIQLKHVPSIG